MLWVASELYYPEQTSTGHVMTAIAEHLAAGRDVRVLAAQPHYSAAGTTAPRRERRNDVEIIRVRSSHLDKNRILGRVLNAVTVSMALAWRAAWAFQRGDRVLVVTNPPLLPFLILLAARLRGARCTLLVHDVHPDQMVAVGMLRRGSLAVRTAEPLLSAAYARFDAIIAIGRDMADLFHRRLGRSAPPIHVITNWSDVPDVGAHPRAGSALLRELGWDDHFVVQYAGNFGRPNAVEALLDAAVSLRDDPTIRFLLVGAGAKLPLARRVVAEERLENVRVLDAVPRTRQSELLAACDVSVVPLVPGMLGLGVPSRAYNVMAAGRPMLVLGHPDSELARVVREHDIGWFVPEDRPQELAEVLRGIARDPAAAAERGRRARLLAEQEFRRERVLDRFADVLEAG